MTSNPRRARAVIAGGVLLLLVAGGVAAEGPALALLPIRDQSGHRVAAAMVDRAIRQELAADHTVLAAVAVRDALRRQRLRDIAAVGPERVAAVASELGVECVLAITVHDADDRLVPRLGLSAMVFDGGDGHLEAMAFVARSGLDSRSWLGLGAITELEVLVAGAVRETLARLGTERPVGGGTRLALVPLSSLTGATGTADAATVTEAVRVAAWGAGLELAAPGCVAHVLRRHPGSSWGRLSRPAGGELATACGVELALTGTVEGYDSGGMAAEAEPFVALSLRLIDLRAGTILWSDALERSGWDGFSPFGLGRRHSHAGVALDLAQRLVQRLLDQPEPGPALLEEEDR